MAKREGQTNPRQGSTDCRSNRVRRRAPYPVRHTGSNSQSFPPIQTTGNPLYGTPLQFCYPKLMRRRFCHYLLCLAMLFHSASAFAGMGVVVTLGLPSEADIVDRPANCHEMIDGDNVAHEDVGDHTRAGLCLGCEGCKECSFCSCAQLPVFLDTSSSHRGVITLRSFFSYKALGLLSLILEPETPPI